MNGDKWISRIRPACGTVSIIRVILFLSLVLGTAVGVQGQMSSGAPSQLVAPSAQAELPAKWSEGVKALAGKIAAAVKPSNAISLDVKNISSLRSSEVEGIRKAIEAELSALGLHVSSGGAQVEITLSENVEGYVWVADIHGSGAREVLIVAAPKRMSDSSGKSEKSVVLAREIVRVQSGKILDFAFTTSQIADLASLVILEPEQWVAHYERESTRAIPIKHSVPWPRDLVGRIDINAGKFAIPGMNCDGGIASVEPVRCTPAPKSRVANKYAQQENVEIDGYVVASATLNAACASAETIVLATGAGDWTQPDTLRAYKVSGGVPVAVSQVIQFPGPILTTWPSDNGKSARVVSKNLETGMYEASIVTVSCSQ